ncbi:MAG: hypothetical protein WDZ35_04845 [Crocinitomicaceae bacterium]
MKCILIFFLLIISIPAVHCQEPKQLVITDHKKEKVRSFDENQRIKVWVDDKKYKGRFEIENDSTIAIGEASILITDITHFKGKIKRSLLAGSLLIGVPIIFTGLTALGGISTGDLGTVYLMAAGILVGSATIPTGILLMTIKKKENLTEERYSLSIQ